MRIVRWIECIWLIVAYEVVSSKFGEDGVFKVYFWLKDHYA